MGSARPDLFIGVMSGTSMDAVDACLVELSPQPDGNFSSLNVLRGHSINLPAPLKERLLALQFPSADGLGESAVVSVALGRLYAQVCNELLALQGIERGVVRAIGVHGQTVRHRPDLGYTLQLNAPALVAELTGSCVVADFRSRDIAAGGQGAPLVCAFHEALFRSDQRTGVLNVGGIANLTVLPELSSSEVVTGFDTGPGNLLMDAWIERHQRLAFDRDGDWAAAGTAIPALLEHLLAEAYFSRTPPKSTGRDLFNLNWLEQKLSNIALHGQSVKPQDVQATLLKLTVQSIARAVSEQDIRTLLVCGGGWRNRALMSELSRALPAVRIQATPIDPQWVEASAFAWLASRCISGLPGNLPAVTGAKGPRICGAIYPA